MTWSFFCRTAKWLAVLTLLSILALSAWLVMVWRDLPNTDELIDIQLQVPMRILTYEGDVIAEYGDKRRLPIRIEAVPRDFLNAIVATEDHRFYEHAGVDVRGLARATLHVIRHGRKSQGGSTITMQVARNYFLTRQKTFSRKFQEILLAIKIDRELSKDKILELYLNKIYFGKNAYGVQAAANVYYGKPVQALSLAQMAMLAGLPQAPSAINPLNNPKGAKTRRNHVLERMWVQGFIDEATYLSARAEPLSASFHRRTVDFAAPYVSDAIRQQLLASYGKSIYTQGLTVVTTIRREEQLAAERATERALIDYDLRHGWRGPLAHLALPEGDEPIIDRWRAALVDHPQTHYLDPAVVLSVDDTSVQVLRRHGELAELQLTENLWARPIRKNRSLGPEPTSFASFLHVGDVVMVEATDTTVLLRQIPEVTGAIVALDPMTGEIRALSGGFHFSVSHFNRALQAQRQTGSVFKPFVYAAALDKGYTAATITNDAPVVQKDPSLEKHWRPKNSSGQFYGPTRLREALTKSRNLVSIRVLDSIGIADTIEYLTRFGFPKNSLPRGLSLALGVNQSTPLDVARGYGILANGGQDITPHLIHHIRDDEGTVLFHANYPIACRAGQCVDDIPELPAAETVIDPRVAYILTSMLQDTIDTGTARLARQLGRTYVAGKTGTTNDHKDNWFAGYSADLVCVTWMGYDDPRPVGEYASRTTLPYWIDFMHQALKRRPDTPWEAPSGLRTVRIDPETGRAAEPGLSTGVFEIFREEYAPTRVMPDDPLPSKRPGSTASLYDLY